MQPFEEAVVAMEQFAGSDGDREAGDHQHDAHQRESAAPKPWHNVLYSTSDEQIRNTRP